MPGVQEKEKKGKPVQGIGQAVLMSAPTVTGKTLAENVSGWLALSPDQKIIRGLNEPTKKTGDIQILRGNLAPNGAVAKIAGMEGVRFEGEAMCFDKECMLNMASNRGEMPRDRNLVLIVRYEGPKSGPGMPEQLKASVAIMGAKLTNVALVTDGRYSGASHGFIVGHVTPEAAVGGPLALVRNRETVRIDAETNVLEVVGVDEMEMTRLTEQWTEPKMVVTRGLLAKYAKLVGDASHGAITDLF